MRADHPAEQPPEPERPARPGNAGPLAAGIGFERWAEALRPRLARLAYRYLWNAHDAEEVVQDAMTLAWREAGRGRPLANRDAWLYRVTIHLCLNRLRRSRAGPLPEADVLIAPGGHPDPAGQADEMMPHVRAAIRELPDRQQAAMVLRDIEGLAYDKIAAILETRPGAARLLVYRAREAVRRILLARWPDTFGPDQ